MKKLSFLALAAVGLLFGACASNDAIDEKGSNPLEGEGQGYFKVGINLPSTPITRADWNEDGSNSQLKDGKASEWAVKTTLLLIFSGTDEASATLAQVTSIANPATSVTDDPNQITVNRDDYVVKLEASTDNNLYALAVINGTGIIEQGSAPASIKINGSGVDQTGVKIGDLQAAISNADATGANQFVDGSNYIFMTNAVLSYKQGGRVDPTIAPDLHILAPIDATRIYATEAEASASTVPAADIYVERGVAKVTLQKGSLNEAALKAKDGSTLADATFAGWCLDNTNKSSYLVRQVESLSGSWDWNLVNHALTASTTTDKYRFVGQTPVDGFYGTKVAGFRTYWCVDPNYAIPYDANNFWEPAAKTFVMATGDDNPLYCYENTFDVIHQTYANTTRAIVGITLNGGADFYTVGADRKTLWKEADIEKLAVSCLFAQSPFATWYADPANGKGTLEGTDGVTITWHKTGAGTVRVTDVTIAGAHMKSGSDYSIASSTDPALAAVIATINTQLSTVKRYAGGVTYYSLRIKHFGDDLTPWDAGEYITAPKEAGIDDIYPDDVRRDANYLGRYGMVRNNWYDIKLGDILGVGSPVIPRINPGNPNPDPDDPTPEDPDHPDDSKEDAYIKARINILSWAKRPQTWNLKK